MPASASREFSQLADLLAEAMLLVSDEGLIHHANGSAARLLKRAAADLIGTTLATLVDAHPQDIAQLIRGAKRTRSFTPGSLLLRQGSNEPLACRCDAALYQGASEEGPALVVLRLTPRGQAASEFVVLREKLHALTREVAARRAAEMALRETSERLRVTLESIGDAVIATDPGGRVEFMNPVAQQLTGWSLEDGRGRHLDDVFVILNEDTRDKVESPVAKVLRVGAAVGLANHTLLVRRDGSELPIDDSGAPIRDERNRMRGVVLVFRDLTERHALERELMAHAARLEEADRRKNEFLSMLAHELRNPLAPVRTGIEILKRRSDAATVQRMTDLMGRQIDHMVRLVDDLLDVSRLTRGKIGLRRAPESLHQILQQAQEMARPAFDAAGIRLAVTQPPQDAVMHCDSMRLVQVLANLLSNAAKFSSSGQQVGLDAQIDGDCAVISVTDEGVGIPRDTLEKVFELFFQEQQGLDRDRGGLGVGLTISRLIVEMHGGTVAAHSEGRGRGSTFTVRLPLLGDTGQTEQNSLNGSDDVN